VLANRRDQVKEVERRRSEKRKGMFEMFVCNCAISRENMESDTSLVIIHALGKF